MNIAIIGGGLTGLSAAYELLKEHHKVTVFEKDSTLGGLAGGFKPTSRRGADASSHRVEASRGGMPNWQWSLEYFYHHFFTNDQALIALAKELGLEKDMLIVNPITATLCESSAVSYQTSERGRPQSKLKNDNIFQLDSPMSLLRFPLLSPIDKVRTAALIGFCKLNPFWQPLEKITAEQFFKTFGGTHAWETLWDPLMTGKFGTYANLVPASWLWARLNKRTMKLGYFQGGFRTFVDGLVKAIEKRGGVIYKNTAVQSMKQDVRNTKYEVRITQKNSSYVIRRTSYFDKILITTPSSIATKLIKFPSVFEKKLNAIPHLFAQTLILETPNPILDSIYWLNINDRSYPFLAVVAHTNMIDKKYYVNHHITYIGNYLPEGHPYLSMSKEQLLKKFLPYLKKINPSVFLSSRLIVSSSLFTAPNAQPVHTLNYSQKAPTLETPIPGIYLSNLDSIYPWDRGTNYAVEMGKRVASLINKR
jgi:protoporphyrinogen oxidase